MWTVLILTKFQTVPFACLVIENSDFEEEKSDSEEKKKRL